VEGDSVAEKFILLKAEMQLKSDSKLDSVVPIHVKMKP
jgi:hypothetical protein